MFLKSLHSYFFLRIPGDSLFFHSFIKFIVPRSWGVLGSPKGFLIFYSFYIISCSLFLLPPEDKFVRNPQERCSASWGNFGQVGVPWDTFHLVISRHRQEFLALNIVP